MYQKHALYSLPPDLARFCGCWQGRKKEGRGVCAAGAVCVCIACSWSSEIRESCGWKEMTQLFHTCLIADSAGWSKEAVCDTIIAEGGVGDGVYSYLWNVMKVKESWLKSELWPHLGQVWELINFQTTILQTAVLLKGKHCWLAVHKYIKRWSLRVVKEK